MSEYIDRAELIKYLFETMQAQTTTSGKAYVRDLYDKVLSVPATYAEPVVHGKWLEIEEIYGDIRWKCSACGIEWCFIEGTPKENGTHYCPNCGAKMTEE